MDKIDSNMLKKVCPILDAAMGHFMRSVEYKDWQTAYILLDAIACTSRKHSDAALKTVEGQKPPTNGDYAKCAEEIMRNLSDRRGIDLYQYDKDIIDDIKISITNIISAHFA